MPPEAWPLRSGCIEKESAEAEVFMPMSDMLAGVVALS